MKNLTFLSFIFAAFFMIAACNNNSKQVLENESTYKEEIIKNDSIITALEKTEAELQTKKEALENALNDLDID